MLPSWAMAGVRSNITPSCGRCGTAPDPRRVLPGVLAAGDRGLRATAQSPRRGNQRLDGSDPPGRSRCCSASGRGRAGHPRPSPHRNADRDSPYEESRDGEHTRKRDRGPDYDEYCDGADPCEPASEDSGSHDQPGCRCDRERGGEKSAGPRDRVADLREVSA